MPNNNNNKNQRAPAKAQFNRTALLTRHISRQQNGASREGVSWDLGPSTSSPSLIVPQPLQTFSPGTYVWTHAYAAR